VLLRRGCTVIAAGGEEIQAAAIENADAAQPRVGSDNFRALRSAS
jgi:hypothetical protein